MCSMSEFRLPAIAEPDTYWYEYVNMDLSSSTCGHKQYLKVGPTCTYKTPPVHMPDTQHGLGWRYRLTGRVDPSTGEVAKG